MAAPKAGLGQFPTPKARSTTDPSYGQIVEAHPPHPVQVEGSFEMLVSNIDWDNFVGRVAVGKGAAWQREDGDRVFLLGKSPMRRRSPSSVSVTKVFQYTTLTTSESVELWLATSSASAALKTSISVKPWPAAADACPIRRHRPADHRGCSSL